jgi:putative Mg2+ transporter-C (MgtC) family protein
MTMQLAQAGLNLFVAACLGAAIGLERQWHQRLAGLRTNTLVALGAAIFVAYSHVVPDGAGDTRIAAQVVSGIGFLGAGVIFKDGLNVRGLNTAATLWCSAAVGLLAGEGLAPYGLMAAALVLGANTALRPIVHAINRQPIESTEEEQQYLVSIDCRAARASDIRSLLVGVRRRARRPIQRNGQRVHRRFRPRRGDCDRDLAQATGAGAGDDRRAPQCDRRHHSGELERADPFQLRPFLQRRGNIHPC